MSKLTRQIVIDARYLIEHEENWVTGTPVAYKDDGTCAYCLGGALAKVAFDNAHLMYADTPETEELMLDFADRAKLPPSEDPYDLIQPIYEYNDVFGHESVLELMDKVIETFNE